MGSWHCRRAKNQSHTLRKLSERRLQRAFVSESAYTVLILTWVEPFGKQKVSRPMKLRLVLCGGIEEHLHQILVRVLSHARPLRHVLRQIKDCKSIIMLCDLHKILCSSVREQIDLFLWIEDRGREVVDEVIIHMLLTISPEIVLVSLDRCPRTFVHIPPVSFSITLILADVAPARHAVNAPVDEDAVLGVIVPPWTLVAVDAFVCSFLGHDVIGGVKGGADLHSFPDDDGCGLTGRAGSCTVGIDYTDLDYCLVAWTEAVDNGWDYSS